MVFSQDPNGGGIRATSVEYAGSGTQAKPWPTVGVTKEVILAGGPVGSPNMLMHSGIGPEDKLSTAGVGLGRFLDRAMHNSYSPPMWFSSD